MAGNFTFNFNGFKSANATTAKPAFGTSTVVVPPTLRSFDLFPTRIWQSPLTMLSIHFERWESTVLAMRAASPEPAGRTNRQGWNSADMAVLEQPAFAPLNEILRAACGVALGEMGVRGTDFQLQSWINMHDRGGFNFLHVHEGCLLCGCFYLKVPKHSGHLVFRDPRAGVVHGAIKGSVPNGYTDIHLTPDAGLLVLFPSWMEHYVEPHGNDEPRISISFNVVKP
ncbi:TIGR02466 family protein [Rhodanobacter sp. L36]|uniref:TIGR02466 family protein n=1 Tax=Rhodanobacter sp. L36 TaxID=1747221 RepID=UPI00131DB33C|nr:TIGR02466 family protein [Rhodanobacter sp. L36]